MSLIKDFENDFGFTIVAEEEINQADKLEVAAKSLKDLRAMIEPFLNNLAAGDDNAVIKWPNRKAKIAEFQKKLDAHVASSLKKLS
jgi:hypothetical protein